MNKAQYEDKDTPSTIEKVKALLDTAKGYWSTIHDQFRQDLKFANNIEQWDEKIKNERLRMGRDCQTYPIIKGFIRPLTNAVKEAPPGITIYPISDSTKDDAKMLSGVCRHIEYNSNAGRAYNHGLENAAEGGLGAWRIIPKNKPKVENVMVDEVVDIGNGQQYIQKKRTKQFVDDTEICFEQISDPTCVYFDPTAKMPDYSDAGYVIYCNTISAKDFRALYPKAEGCDTLAEDVEIYELWQIADSGFVNFIVFDTNEILVNDMTEMTILPFVLITGSKIDVDGVVQFSSITRDLRAVQQEINWLKSEAISSISSAPKSMFIADEGSLINEDAWASSATDPDVVLYKKAGKEVTPIVAPGPPVGYMELASQNIEMARQISGIYPDPSTQSALSNASGKAIKYQQAGAHIQTYHYIEALNYGVKRSGEILLDQISVYYNDDKIRMSMGVDNTFKPVSIGPTQVDSVSNIDLTNAKYGVVISNGPSYSTQKEALMDQLLEMGRTNPNILPLISDVIVKNLNLPGSEELADRFKVMMPPQIQELLKAQEQSNNSPSEIIRNQAIQLQTQAAEFQQLQQNAQALAEELEKAKSQEQYKIADLQMKKEINDDNIRSKFAMQQADHEQDDQIAKLNATMQLILAKLNGENKVEVENVKSFNKVSEIVESKF